MQTKVDHDQEYDLIFKQAWRIADQPKDEPNILRVDRKQIRRNNVPANSPEKYCKRGLATLVVDPFISEMAHRFNNLNCKAAKLLILTQSILRSGKIRKNVDISTILEEREDDLINRGVLGHKLLFSQCKWLALASKNWANTLPKAIKEYDEERLSL